MWIDKSDNSTFLTAGHDVVRTFPSHAAKKDFGGDIPNFNLLFFTSSTLLLRNLVGLLPKDDESHLPKELDLAAPLPYLMHRSFGVLCFLVRR